jgi:hypothetical protein
MPQTNNLINNNNDNQLETAFPAENAVSAVVQSEVKKIGREKPPALASLPEHPHKVAQSGGKNCPIWQHC